ncbi:adenylosuccinate synthetase isozyme 2, partial [Striga asiatica]
MKKCIARRAVNRHCIHPNVYGFRPCTLSVLPLYSPPVKTRSNVMWMLVSAMEAKTIIPWARPTISASKLGPVLTGSSRTATSPKNVGEEGVELAMATFIGVGRFATRGDTD